MKKPSVLFLIGGILSLMIAMGIGRFAYTPILPLMQKDLTFSNTIAGYIASSNYGGYLLGAILASVIPLKKQRVNSLRTSLIINILTTALMGVTHSYLLWYVLRFLSGVASAFVLVCSSGIALDRLAAINKTSWSGLFYGGVGFGIFFSSLMIPGLSHSFHWEGAWIGLAIISGVLFLFVWYWLIESPNTVENTLIQETSAAQVPPNSWIIWLIIAYGLEGLGYIVTGTFIVSIAEKTSAFHNGATLVWMLVGVTGIPSCMVWSFLAKKWGYIKSLVLAMILQSIGIGIPAFWSTQTSFILSALLYGATFMGITTLATTLGRQMNPSNSSRTIGILTAVYAVGQLIGPILTGIISSFAHNFTPALIGASSVVLIGAVCLLKGIRFERNFNEKNSSLQ